MSQARRSSIQQPQQQPQQPQQQAQPPSPPQQQQSQQQERGQQWRPVWRGGGAYRGRGKRVQGDSNGHALQRPHDIDLNNGSHHEQLDQLPQSLDDRINDDDRLQHEIREVADRIAQLQRVEGDLRSQLAARSEVARLQKALADSQEHVEQIEAQHRQALWEKDEHLQQLAQQVQQKEAELWAKETQLQERDEQILEARQQVGEELNAERTRASTLEADVVDRDRRLEQLERQLDGLLAREEEAERQLQDANNQLEEQLEQIRNKDAQLVDTSQHVEDMRQQWAQQIEEMRQYHLQQAHGLQQQLRETREQLHGMWLGSQAAAAQHVEHENYHRAYVHQLQVQLKEAHDRLAAAGIQPVLGNRAYPAEFVPQQSSNLRLSEPLPNATAVNHLLATQPHPSAAISSPPLNNLHPANGTPPQPTLPSVQSSQAEHSSDAQAPSSHMSQGVAAASLANGLSAAAGPFQFGSLPTPDPTLLQTLMPAPNKNGVIGPKMESSTSAVAVTPIAVVRPASQGRNSNIAKSQDQSVLQDNELQTQQPQQQQQLQPQEQQHPPEAMLTADKQAVRKDAQRRHDNRKPKDGSTKRDDRWRSKGKEKLHDMPERSQ